MAIGLAKQFVDIAGDFMKAFGGSVTYTPSGGSAKTITAVFNDPYNAVEVNGVEYASANYTLLAKTSDMTTVDLDDTVTVESVVYTVISVEPMDTGITRLELEK